MDQRFQTIVDTLARNNETLNRIEGGVTATVITNIAESRHWVDLRSRFWVYNGLWKLPAEDFSETFEQLIRKNGVAWRVLFFAGVTEKERDVARRRYERMRASILVWREQIPDLASNFTVRIVQNLPLPGSTFFLSERDGKPLVRLYVDVLMRSETPRLCFEFPSAAVVNGLQIEFDSVWDTGQVATIDEIVAHASLDAMLQRLQTAV